MKNILLIICDQLSAQALRVWGNCYAKTPNMDSIIEEGVRFDSTYASCPLCQPVRASFWTGLYPHQTGVLSNGRKHHVPQVPDSVPTVGSVFSDAGYRTVHFGKRHDAGSLRGFENFPVGNGEVDDEHPAWPLNSDTFRDVVTRQQTVQFLNDYKDRQPFLAVADLINPHNICGWIGEFQGQKELIRPGGDLPQLPSNLYHNKNQFEKLPKPIQYICCAHNRQAQISQWDEEKIHHYLRAYHHYMQRVDDEIGRILSALKAREDADDTLVVLMADHGDSMCGRWMATKHTSFYDETTKVPFVFAGPGIEGKNRSVSGLTSLLDLFPTLCDYAGIELLTQVEGRSLLPWLQGRETKSPHEYVASQWHTEWGFTIEPGRMIRTECFKYTHYLEEEGEELYDLRNDPGELNNLIDSPEYLKVLKDHRELLREHVAATEDPYFTLQWKADPQWRSHKPGYRNHRGIAAPMSEQ